MTQCALRRIQRGVVEAVVGRHPGAAVADQPGFLQAGQVGGHARLRQRGDGRQLGHGQLFLFQQRQQAHAGGVGEHLQAGRPVFQIHKYLPIEIERYFAAATRQGQGAACVGRVNGCSG